MKSKTSSRIQIKNFSDGTLAEVNGPLDQVSIIGYSAIFDAHRGENQLVISLSPGQDGNTPFAVIQASVDGGASFVTGAWEDEERHIVPTKSVEAMIRQTT